MLSKNYTIFIEHEGRLCPIKIKFKVNLDKADIKGLAAFRDAYQNQDIAPGIIIYAGDICRYLAHDIIAVPWGAVLYKGAIGYTMRVHDSMVVQKPFTLLWPFRKEP